MTDEVLDPIQETAYIFRATEGYLRQLNQRSAAEFEAAKIVVKGFVRDNLPLLRHYRATVVGECLAIEDQNDQRQGFWVHMASGDHLEERHSCRSWEYNQGSYRDDGAYLALAAREYLRTVRK